MTNDDYNHFVCIVAGENPAQLMEEYDSGKKVSPYAVYKYKDAAKLHQQTIELYTKILNNKELSEIEKEEYKETLDYYKEIDDNEFYIDFTEGYTLDEKTGNAMSVVNPKGKWKSYTKGKIFSIPFLLKDGREIFQARKEEIDWSKIHLFKTDVYKRAWEMVMEKSEPQNDYETNIYENMKNRTFYFQKFGSKENYIISNTAFWGYAFLSEDNGWTELEEKDNQFEWVRNYYDRFIKNLPDDTLLTIYECTK